MTTPLYHGLFLCDSNSARSIIAESLLNRLGNGRFQAHSGGSHPAGQVHPLALEVLEQQSYPTAGLRSKHWQEFHTPDAPEMDFIITLCDRFNHDQCPDWPGEPASALWHFDDPAKIEGDHQTQLAAFCHSTLEIAQRLKLFLSLPADKLNAMARHHHVQQP